MPRPGFEFPSRFLSFLLERGFPGPRLSSFGFYHQFADLLRFSILPSYSAPSGILTSLFKGSLERPISVFVGNSNFDRTRLSGHFCFDVYFLVKTFFLNGFMGPAGFPLSDNSIFLKACFEPAIFRILKPSFNKAFLKGLRQANVMVGTQHMQSL